MRYSVSPNGVCPSRIEFDLDGNVVKNISFIGGCNGNLKAISKLVDGMTVDKVKDTLLGITCGFKNTSCSDQLARALMSALEESKDSNGGSV